MALRGEGWLARRRLGNGFVRPRCFIAIGLLVLAGCGGGGSKDAPATATSTYTARPSLTATPRATTTLTVPPSPTFSVTRTASEAPSLTATRTPTLPATATPPPPDSPTATPTGSVTQTPTQTDTSVPTATHTRTPLSAPINSDLGAATNGGGCYPEGFYGDATEMLQVINPHWAAVNRGSGNDTEPLFFSGVVASVHGDTAGDFPIDHTRSDVVIDILLDEEQKFRAATGNPPGIIALEWDGDGYPEFAWPGVGDRMELLGRWIWDCGHTGARPGLCSATQDRRCVVDRDCRPPVCDTCAASETCEGEHFGYSTEVHPPHATAVIREGRGGIVSDSPDAKPVLATRADVWVSPYGGGAADGCLQTHLANPVSRLSLECYPLTKPLARIHAVDFEFKVPLPPQPPGGVLSYRMVERQAYGDIPAAIDILPRPEAAMPHLEVRVKMTEATDRGLPTGFAGTIFAGWVEDPTPLTHIRLTVTGLEVRNALQRRTPVVPRVCETTPQGERCTGVGSIASWHMQANVNGEWLELTGLEKVHTGDVIPQTLVFEQYLRPTDKLRLQARGAGDDCIAALFGRSFRRNIAEYGFANTFTCMLTLGGHDTGSIDVEFAGPDFGAADGIADYVAVSNGGNGGTCAASGSLCVVDEDCAPGEGCITRGGASALRYRIERLPN